MSVKESPRFWGAAAAGAAGLAGGVVLAAAVGVARAAARVDRGTDFPVAVLRLEAAHTPGGRARVWLTGAGVSAPGRHSLLFDAPGTPHPRPDRTEARGHARLGPVVARSGGAVAREVLGVDRGSLEAGCSGRMVGWWYASPDELGYRVEEITYESELGPMGAWIVHPRRSWRPRGRRWAIHMHGRGASPAETFRGIEPFAHAGITSLIVRYRNDEGEPEGLNGRYGMGLSESRDLDAAIAAVRARGAERVTLVGWSMGGTASLVSATRGVHRDVIDGLVLDSPGVDWSSIIRAHTRESRVPGWIADLGMRLLAHGCVASGEPGGIDLGTLTPAVFASGLEVPVLLLASPDDRYVSWDGARELARLRPELVQFASIPGAGHVRLWNTDPEKWEETVLGFVSALPKPGWRGQ